VTTLPSKTNTTANIGVYSAHIKQFILKINTVDKVNKHNMT